MKSRVAKRGPRFIQDGPYFQMVTRIVRGAGQRAASGDIESFVYLNRVRADLDQALIAAVDGLRASGHTWEEIGAATGVTRQAALMKWSHRAE